MCAEISYAIFAGHKDGDNAGWIDMKVFVNTMAQAEKWLSLNTQFGWWEIYEIPSMMKMKSFYG